MSKLKKLGIAILSLFGIVYWPLGLGGLLAFLAYKYIKNKKFLYPLIAAILLPALWINSIWAEAMVSPSKVENVSPQTTEQTATPTPSGEVNGVQTAQTPTPTPTPTPEPSPSETPKTPAKLISVTDGDTIRVSINGKTEPVRIIGINTPETVDPRKPVECMGAEASKQAKLYFEQSGTDVWLESDPTQGDRDKYQRLLRYVWTDDQSIDYGKVIIALGYANEYTYNTPYKYQDVYKQAQKEAQVTKKGLWADNACANFAPAVKATPKPTVKPAASKQPTTQTITAPVTPPVTSTGGDKDCPDFANHAEAQAYFLSKGGSPTNNVDRLDRDRDGLACED